MKISFYSVNVPFPLNQPIKFIVLEKQGSLFFSTRILCDIKTEIVYVWIRKGYSGGLSVLLKSDGTPYKKNEYLKEQNKL